MKIRSVTPLVHHEFPNVMHVEIETDEGIVGLGETYYFAETVAQFIREFAGRRLLGKTRSSEKRFPEV